MNNTLSLAEPPFRFPRLSQTGHYPAAPLRGNNGRAHPVDHAGLRTLRTQATRAALHVSRQKDLRVLVVVVVVGGGSLLSCYLSNGETFGSSAGSRPKQTLSKLFLQQAATTDTSRATPFRKCRLQSRGYALAAICAS